MESNKVPLLAVVRKHGVGMLCRETGLSRETVHTAMYGKRIPSQRTAEKISAALGLKPTDIEWPKGFGDPYQITYYPDDRFKAAVEAEVERRLVARQLNSTQTAAQSNEATSS